MTMNMLDDHRSPDTWSDEPSGGWRTDAPSAFPPPVPPPPRTHRGRRRAITLLAAAALVGGASGYVGSTLASNELSAPVASSATIAPASVISTGSGMDVGAIVAAVEPSVVIVSADVTVRQGPFTQSGTSAGTGIILTCRR